MFWNPTLFIEVFTFWKIVRWIIVLVEFFWIFVFFFVWLPSYLIKRLFRKTKLVEKFVPREFVTPLTLDIDIIKERALNRAYERMYYDEEQDDQTT